MTLPRLTLHAAARCAERGLRVRDVVAVAVRPFASRALRGGAVANLGRGLVDGARWARVVAMVREGAIATAYEADDAYRRVRRPRAAPKSRTTAARRGWGGRRAVPKFQDEGIT